MHKRCLIVAAAVPLTGATATATADALRATLAQPLREVAHEIDAALYPGYAKFTIRRAFQTDGPKPDEAVLDIHLPSDAVANHLAIKGANRWYDATLLEANEAARTYERLTGFGAARLKDPALLYWVSNDELTLQVFPVVKGATSWVRYDVVVPGRFEHGRYMYDVPGCIDLAAPAEPTSPSNLTAPRLRVLHTDNVLDATSLLRADGETGDFYAAAGATDCAAALSLRPKAFSVRVQAVHFQVASDRLAGFADVAIGQLSKVPKQASIVLVLDVSYSMDKDRMERQRLAADAYLSHMPDAKVAIITYARSATRWQNFADVATTRRRLATLGSVSQQNGSHIDVATAMARELIARAPTKGPRRIVIWTDSEWRSAMSAELMQQSLTGTSAIAHSVVVAESGNQLDDKCRGLCELHENDELTLAMRQTGGIATSFQPEEPAEEADLDEQHEQQRTVAAKSNTARSLAAQVLHLVRPVRLMDAEWILSGAAPDAHQGQAISERARRELEALDPSGTLEFWDLREDVQAIDTARTRTLTNGMLPRTLAEGEGLSASALVQSPRRLVAIEGYLWGKQVRYPVGAFTRATDAGALLAVDLANVLTDIELFALARWSRAVTRISSLLAVEPGTRPSTEGLRREGGIGFGSIGSGDGRGVGIGHSAGLRMPPVATWNDILGREVAACIKAHRPQAAWRAEFSLERQSGELLDVHDRTSTGISDAMKTCLREAFWGHRLTGNEPSSPSAELSAP